MDLRPLEIIYLYIIPFSKLLYPSRFLGVHFFTYFLLIKGGDRGPAAATQRGEPGSGHHPPSADRSADCQQTGQRQAGTGQC